MSEFEKELEKSKSHDRMFPNYYHEKILIKLFKDWQPPKPLVVVPQIIADWIELIKQRNRNVLALLDSDDMPCDVYDWLFIQEDDENIKLILLAWVKGYTVEKEHKFSLVNKITGEYLVLPAIEYRIKNENIFDHSAHFKKDDLPEWKPEMYQFTEVEIASMNTGSYEQIEVEP